LLVAYCACLRFRCSCTFPYTPLRFSTDRNIRLTKMERRGSEAFVGFVFGKLRGMLFS